MAAKIKSNEFQLLKIKSLLTDLKSNKLKQYNYTDDHVELIEYAKKNDLFEKYKEDIKYTILRNKKKIDTIFILLELRFKKDDKNTIRINENIINVIGEFEKIFIDFNNIKQLKVDGRVNHYILLFLEKTNLNMDKILLEDN